MSTGNGTNTGSVNLGMGVNSGGYNNAGTNGGRVPQNHLQPQPPHHLYPAMGGVGQPHAHHTINHSDQRGPSQQNSPRVGSSNWSGSQGHRKGVGNQGRPPAGERGSTGEKMFAPPSKLKQVCMIFPLLVTLVFRKIIGDLCMILIGKFCSCVSGQVESCESTPHSLFESETGLCCEALVVSKKEQR